MTRRWLTLCSGFAVWLGLASVALAQGGGYRQAALHVVQRGENLYRIAALYDLPAEAIAQANGLTDLTDVQVGQRLLIPGDMASAASATTTRHAVQPGETLRSLALRYGTTAAQLAALNHIVNPDRLFVGQVLNVGQAAPDRPAYTHGTLHTVRSGETLYRIAVRYGASLNAIVLANHLASPTRLYPGQRLLIPGPDSAPPLLDLPAPLVVFEIAPLPAEVGRTFRVRLAVTQPVSVQGTFMNRALHFSPEPDGLTFDAFYGVHAFSVPGLYPLTLTLRDAAGNSTTITEQVHVLDGRYATEEITLEPGLESLLDPTLADSERALVAEVMSGYTAQRYFDGQMGLPSAAPVTSPFGTRRSYNGGPYDSFHTGADFGAPADSPIFAPAPGVVVFAGWLQVRGLATVLDHGRGVYTGYWHQTESYVQVGQFVNAGTVLGTVGSTGRVTGAHLHWEMWVNGVEVDPLQWVRVSFP